MRDNPSISPPVAATFPDDPFERWMAEQALAGHDRMWLRRNAAMLRKRWERNPSPLQPPPPVSYNEPPDRYSEV